MPREDVREQLRKHIAAIDGRRPQDGHSERGFSTCPHPDCRKAQRDTRTNKKYLEASMEDWRTKFLQQQAQVKALRTWAEGREDELQTIIETCRRTGDRANEYVASQRKQEIESVLELVAPPEELS